MSIDEKINSFMAPVSDSISGIMFYSISLAGTKVPLIVLWLIAGGIVFTLYLRFINIRGFRQAIRVVRGDYSDPETPGEVSHFQALSAALSGTVGLGNIAGVAVAISWGGPGAIIWMMLAGFLGMSLKFAECTLGVKYRRVNAAGAISGGPMYYLQDGFAKLGWPKFGKATAIFFSLMCIPGTFAFFTANQSFQQFSSVSGFNEGWIYGVVYAVLVGLVIIGGIKSIARVTGKLVPMMCALYFLGAIIILLVNATEIPAAMITIIKEAVAPEAVEGGVIGVIIQGFRRAAYSCEAGMGSAPIAHSTVRTNEPVSEGLVALLEPFIDTVVVCTLTALVIVVTGVYKVDGLVGVSLTSAAFGTVVSWFPLVLTGVIILFAFSTTVTWAYYGMKAWTYLVGETENRELAFKIIICLSAVAGASMDLHSVIYFVDSVMFAMAIPNILILYFLAAEIRADLADYMRRVKSGEIKSRRG